MKHLLTKQPTGGEMRARVAAAKAKKDQALTLLREGLSVHEVKVALGVCERTLRKWRAALAPNQA